MLYIENLTIHQHNRCLFNKLHLEIPSGNIMTLMGPSGSGKSTLLNWLIGAPLPQFQITGAAWLNKRRIDGLPIALRQVGILFQEDVLFPHLSVGGNLAFALPAGEPKQRRQQIEQALTDADLTGFYARDPASLSGGQRARVSVLRALLAKPQALLLDEPFSRLDVTLRQQFREFVYEQIATQQIPALLVTHDQADVPPTGQVLTLPERSHV